MKLASLVLILVSILSPISSFALVSNAPVSSNTFDGSGNAITSTGNALDMNIKSGTATLGAGSAIVGKFGIDQTTPGTTNAVQVTGSLPAGTQLLGKTGIDQTTPGSTNAVSHAYIGTAAVAVGSGASNTGTQRMIIATDQPSIPVSFTSTVATNSTTYTATASGATLDQHLSPVKTFTLAVKATGTVTSWTVILEGSLDNVNFTPILTHTNVTPGDGVALFTGTSLQPVLYLRSRCSAITLGTGTNVVATILGT